MLDFSKCRCFSLDEFVGLPADDPHSFRQYIERHLLSKVNLRRQNAQFLDGTAADLTDEAARYESCIAESGGIDLQLLGIGLNGHIGFNEPPSRIRSRTHVQALSSITRAQLKTLFADPPLVPRLAITMGVGTILASRQCLLLVIGAEKARIAAAAIAGPVSKMVPASALQLHANCTVVLDQAAANRLEKAGALDRLSTAELQPPT